MVEAESHLSTPAAWHSRIWDDTRRLQQLGPAAEDLCKDSEQRTLVPRPNLEIQSYFPADFLKSEWLCHEQSCKLSLQFLLFLFWIHFLSQTFTFKSFTSGTLCCGVRIWGTTWGVVDPRFLTTSSWLQFHDAIDVCVHRQPTKKYHEAPWDVWQNVTGQRNGAFFGDKETTKNAHRNELELWFVALPGI